MSGKNLLVLLVSAFLAMSMAGHSCTLHPTKMVTYGTLEIQQVLIPASVDEAKWNSDYSVEFTRKIMRGNLFETSRISFDASHFRRELVDNQWDWLGRSIEIFDKDAQKGSFCKEHQFMNLSIPFYPEWQNEEIVEEVEEPEIRLQDEYKEILGHRCQKALWSKSDGLTREVWFATDLVLAEWLRPLWGLEGITGLILEMVVPAARNQVAGRHFLVTELDLNKPDASSFEVSDDFSAFAKYTEAREAINKAALEAAAKETSKPANLTGPWKLVSEHDTIFLELVSFGKDFRLQQLHPGSEVQSKLAIPGDKHLWVQNGKSYQVYSLNSEGNLLTRADHPAFQFKKVSLQEVHDAMDQ